MTSLQWSPSSRQRRTVTSHASSYSVGNTTTYVDIIFRFDTFEVNLSDVGITLYLQPITVTFDHKDVNFDPSAQKYITITVAC